MVRWLWVAMLLGLPVPPVAAAGAESLLCEVDAGDSGVPGWMRRQRVLERIGAQCRAGDVLRLFPFEDSGHGVDGAQVAPLVCRFDAQILLLGGPEAPRWLVCVYAGGTRRAR
jgi:hypothetical protein